MGREVVGRALGWLSPGHQVKGCCLGALSALYRPSWQTCSIQLRAVRVAPEGTRQMFAPNAHFTVSAPKEASDVVIKAQGDIDLQRAAPFKRPFSMR
jgi:hypothetical protein